VVSAGAARGAGGRWLRRAALVLVALVGADALPLQAQEAPASPPAVVSGKVTREGEGIGGARVFAYAGFAAFLERRPAALSAPSGDDGVYRLALPAGTYILAAQKLAGDGDGPLPAGGLFAYHGSNPFTLAPGSTTEVSFSLVRTAAEPAVAAAGDPGAGTLTGIATRQGKPLAGATVKLYLDAGDDFRGMGYASAPPTDESGAFRFDFLPESAYFVVARKRAAGPAAGPLAEGDFFGWFWGNPVAVRGGTEVAIELELVSKGRDTGSADSRPRPSGTSISGRIVDAAGAAVPGAHAFAYEEKVMSHKKPAFLSAAAGADGRYVLHLARGGTFYVGARSGYGDSPAKGEWYGLYDGTADHAVSVDAGGAREGVDIVVERILE
jgi:hypothetical protein